MNPYFQRDGIVIYHGDCREILPGLAAVDLVLTDPPYGIPVGAAFVREGCRIERMLDGSGEWNDGIGLVDWLPLAAPLVVPGGHVATFLKREDVPLCGEVAAQHGLEWWHWYFIVKDAPPPTPRPTFVSAVEACALMVKAGAKRRWYGTGYEPNRWAGLTPNRRNESWGHPTEKPREPLITLVRCLSPDGGTVLDPFMGSGTTLRAAMDLGRKAIGIEIEERYCEIAARRLDQMVLPLVLA